MPIYGREYVAIPASWMSLWKGHCTAQDAPPGPIKTASLSDPDNELLLRRGVVSRCSPGRVHPKRISFCALCRQVENQDYVLVIDSIFAKLKEWHGVEGPEYARPVVLTADAEHSRRPLPTILHCQGGSVKESLPRLRCVCGVHTCTHLQVLRGGSNATVREGD